MPFRDPDERQLAGRYPVSHARLGRYSRGEPVHDPGLEIDFRAGYQLLASLQAGNRSTGIQQGPADRAGKPDRVVLDAIPLPVIRDKFLMLTLLAIAPHLVTGLVTQHRRNSSVEYPVVLPRERELQTRLCGQVQDPGAELSRFRIENSPVPAPRSGVIGFTLSEAVRRSGQLRGCQQTDTTSRKPWRPENDLPPQ